MNHSQFEKLEHYDVLLHKSYYLYTPQASELLCCGVVRAAHALPQLVRVGYIIVHIICDIHETWITNKHT